MRVRPPAGENGSLPWRFALSVDQIGSLRPIQGRGTRELYIVVRHHTARIEDGRDSSDGSLVLYAGMPLYEWRCATHDTFFGVAAVGEMRLCKLCLMPATRVSKAIANAATRNLRRSFSVKCQRHSAKPVRLFRTGRPRVVVVPSRPERRIGGPSQ